jgi:tetratricopeptide (TPR) repeat protein
MMWVALLAGLLTAPASGPTATSPVERTLNEAAALRQTGDFRGALDLLRGLPAASLTSADRLRLAYELAAAYVEAGRLEMAVNAARECLAEAPTKGEPSEWELRLRLLEIVAHLRLAEAKTGEPHLAIGLALARDLLDRGLRARAEVLDLVSRWQAPRPQMAKDNALVQVAAAEALLRQEKYAEAAAALNAFLGRPVTAERRALRPHAWFTLGAIRFRTGAFRESGECFARAVSEASTAEATAEAAYNTTVACEHAWRSGRERQDLRAYVAALRMFVEKFPQHPKAEEARWRLARTLLLDLEDDEAAATAFEGISRADPEWWLARRLVAECRERQLAALVEAASAAASRPTSIPTAPTRPTPLPAQAEIVRAAEQAVHALNEFSREVAQAATWPDESTRTRARREAAEARLRAAEVLMRSPLDRSAEATALLAPFEAEFDEAKDLGPRVAALRLQASLLAGRFDEAEQLLRDILRAFPTELDTLRALSAVEARLKADLHTSGTEEAKTRDLHLRLARLYACFVRWLEAQQDEYAAFAPDHRLRRALEMERGGQAAEALALLDGLGDQTTRDETLLEALAGVYERAGWFDAALDRLRSLAALRREGTIPWFEAEYAIARLHLKRGRPEEGLRLIGVLRLGWPTLGTLDMEGRFNALEKELKARLHVQQGRP